MSSERDPWNNLLAAIFGRAYLDYEILISDKPDMHMPKDVTIKSILLFTGNDAIIQKIDEAYKEFRHIVRTHSEDIIRDWTSQKAKTLRKGGFHNNYRKLKKLCKYKCPLCGGILHPGNKKQGSQDYIVCTHCCLNMKIPEEVRKRVLRRH